MRIALGLALFVPSIASANGSYSHVHISQLAVARLEAGALRELLSDPALVPMYEAGSMFPDSGYAVSDDYGELAHWEPFLSAYIAWMRVEYAGDYSSSEAREHVAFLLGVASHGLADQTYDTSLLARAFEVDGPEVPEAPVDQFADYFITIDQGVSFTVDPVAPYADLPAVIADASGGHVVTEDLLMMAMQRMSAALAVQGNPRLVRSAYFDAWEHYPFLGTHIYNDEARGSLPWIAGLVTQYWEIVWRRLHATADVDVDLIIRTVPEDGGENWPIDQSADVAWSRIALFFGYGVVRDQIAALLALTDAAGASVPFHLESAYDGQDRNLVYVVPDATLAYDSVYTLELAAGVETISGEMTAQPYLFSFRTRCADDRLSDCPPLDPPLVTGMMPMPPERDAGMRTDAGMIESSGGCSASGASSGSISVAWIVLALARLRRARRA